MTRPVIPYEEALKANLYKTLVKLDLSRGLYMNWNYTPFNIFVGDTRWNL